MKYTIAKINAIENDTPQKEKRKGGERKREGERKEGRKESRREEEKKFFTKNVT